MCSAGIWQLPHALSEGAAFHKPVLDEVIPPKPYSKEKMKYSNNTISVVAFILIALVAYAGVVLSNSNSGKTKVSEGFLAAPMGG